MFQDTDRDRILVDACRDLTTTQKEHDDVEFWAAELKDAIACGSQHKQIDWRRNLLEFQRHRLARK